MYKCDLNASISFGMCWGVVVLGGMQSLALNYNIRHEDLHEKVTFYNTQFEQLPHSNLWGIINT